MAVNLRGPFICVQEVLPDMLAAEWGRIVNISSSSAQGGQSFMAAYVSSKAGLIGFTKALALELAPRRITVNAICPGWVDTDMARAGMQAMADALHLEFDEARRQALAAVPLGRILEPEEIGATVVWLCSDGARGMTGQAISHCGGQVMW